LNGIFVISQSLVKYRKHIDSITSKQGRGSFMKYLEWLSEKDLNNQINNKKHWLELINQTRPDDFLIYSNLIEIHIKNLISDREEIKNILKSKNVFFIKIKALRNKRLKLYVLSYYTNLLRPIYYRILMIKNNL
jgi:hypothetical protein